ncbi:MAG: hypothetical protein ACE5G0_07845 [Rhodothermales bacterium]
MRFIQRGIAGLLGMALVAVGSGCGSVVPIGDPADAVFVPELVGEWQQITGPGERPARMTVLNFNDIEYYVELREDGGPSEMDTLRVRAYITRVNGTSFINAQTIDSVEEDERRFFFFTFHLNRYGTLILREVNDPGEGEEHAFETSEALRAFIRQNVHNDALYGESVAFVKQHE